MRDFWRTSGFHLLSRDDSGRLEITPDFLRAYLGRPEIAPVEDSCAAELKLHDDLLADPLRPVGTAKINAIEDEDARENYVVFLRFRDHLVAAGTVERAYESLMRGEGPKVPVLFFDQLVHVVLRNILDGCTDALRVRAAELMFRAQKVTIQEQSIMVADDEIVEMHAFRDREGGIVHFDHIGQLLGGAPPASRTVELDIIDGTNANAYWARSDRFDTVLDIGFTRPGLDAFCRVVEAWIRHFRGIEVTVYPVQAIRDERWSWHVGLDVEATAMLNDLYNGVPLSEERNYRLLSLFRAEFKDDAIVLPQVRGRPVYMAMAMTDDARLRIKPQNLLANLPLTNMA